MTSRDSQEGKSVLVTGACGEIGQALVQELARRGGYRIVTADIAPLPEVDPSRSRRARAGGPDLQGQEFL